MVYRYKLIISSRNLYREVELAPDVRQLKLGTGTDCDVRLRKNLFFGDIELLFVKNDNVWSVICSDNLYLTEGDIRKLMTRELRHGDILEVRYNDGGNSVFFLEFIIDFDNGTVSYDRIADVSRMDAVTIGRAAGSNICISSPYAQNDAIRLVRQRDGMALQILHAAYGVYHNGKKAQGVEKIKDGDFFTLADYFFCYNNGRLWMQIREDMQLNGIAYQDHPIRNGYPRFSRNSRVKTVINEETIEILDPPAKPEKPKANVISRIVPALGMLIAAGLMVAISKNATMLIFSGMSAVMGVITGLIGMKDGKKDYEEKTTKRMEQYNAYIAKKREAITGFRQEELKAREEIYISPEEEKNRFDEFSPLLFDRRPEDADFLEVRLGTGAVTAARKVNYKKKEVLEIEDELQTYPEKVRDEFEYLQNAPVSCSFRKAGVVGVIGKEENRFGLLKNLVIDLAARHYYSDVKFVFVADKERAKRVHWLRMLPQVFCDDIRARLLVTDADSKNLVFEYLYKLLSERSRSKDLKTPHMVLFFYDQCGFANHPISRFTDKAESLGVTFVFFGDRACDVPMGCKYFINLLSGSKGELVDTSDKSKTVAFDYRAVTDEEARSVVRILAPVYTEEISLESTLTKNITMFQMLNILAVDDLNLTRSWASTNVTKSMSAPIGVSKTGMVNLDLHDKAHGPHGLVAGTTGSGKSEILQTYILSMSLLFHPYEVGFVIIDFKGGGMVNQFRTLPHLLGAITNIDGKEINRSLKSIKAELRRRQKYFAEADVNHIDKYIRKFKAGEVKEPLPHLIIIVDEFAELKAEQPEFMKELISAARIGRSLGVHLILATQKPAGQVNEQIWSNSRFKLCLKVQTPEDSNEMLKSPLAAEIKEPGRAYMQVGNNEIFELFQSAYSGASERSEEGNVKEFTIYSLDDAGRRTPVFSQKKNKADANAATQLDAIVKYVHNYCEQQSIQKLPDICLPSLAKRIDYPDINLRGDRSTMRVPLGMFDDPDNQLQGTYSVDLMNNNLMVIGSAQGGKTNLLQSIIRYLAATYTPEEVNIYVIDFASMVLKNFEKLNHVGGVVTASEDEKLKNLFKLLYEEIERRKNRLVAEGVSSFAAYMEAGLTDLPQIVLMVDNLTALKELYFQDDDRLLGICRDGITVGISVVIANSQTQGIGYKYLSNFGARIAFFCNDSGEYSSLFESCRQTVENIPGRCLVEIDKTKLDCQAYLAFTGEKEFERVAAIRSFVEGVNELHPGSLARRIPLIPASLTDTYIRSELSGYTRVPFTLVAGLNYATVSPCVMDFTTFSVLGISGKEKSGKHNWVRYAVHFLQENNPGKLKLYISEGMKKRYAEFKGQPYTETYTVMPTDATVIIKDLELQLKERYDAMLAGREDEVAQAPLLLYVIDSMDAAQAISDDFSATGSLKNVVGKYKNLRVCIIISCLENASIPYGGPDLIKVLKDQRNVLFFDEISNLKIYDVTLSTIKQFKRPLEMGDAFYFHDSDCMKLKTPLYTGR